MRLPLADGLLFLALTAAPLLYGSVHFYSLLALALLGVLGLDLVVFERPGTFRALLRSPWTGLGLGFLCVIGIQLAPWPAGWVRAVSPAAYAFYAEYLPGGVGPGSFLTLSLYPSDTVRGLIQYLTYGAFFLIVLARLAPGPGRDEETHPVSLQKSEYLKLGCLTGVLTLVFHSLYDFNLHIPANGIYFCVLLALSAGAAGKNYDHAFFRRVVDFVIAFGFLIALFAILQKFSYNRHIFWIGMKAPNPVGPYYNYDHYAGFMGLCSAVATGRVVANTFHTSFAYRKGLVEKVLWFSTREANRSL
nr:hypothetical protein [Candidatus Omnitrophota bacterium]